MHPRQRIREAVAAQLTGKTAAGNRVFPTRAVPLRRVELPALAVYTPSESVEPASRQTAPRELRRVVQVVVEGVVNRAAGVDDALDALALEVETALHVDDSLGGAASDLLLLSSELDVFDDAAQTVGVVRLEFEATYYTLAPEPGELDEFKTAGVKHGELAEDVVHVEE